MQINDMLSKLKITQLNRMQEDSIEVILHNDKDVIILSPTGSGKTFAYLLPLIQLLDSQSNSVQAIIIVPGRELALQSANVLKSMNTGIRAFASYGGRTTMEEHKAISQIKPHIVFATPGKLNDHIDKDNFNTKDVKFLVIDEFDKCLEMGFQEEMKAIIDKLRSVRRRILVSATDAEIIPDFINIGRSFKIDYLSSKEQIPKRIKVYKVNSPTKDKLETLSGLLKTVGEKSSIVFLNHRESVERTADFLYNNGFVVSSFHGGMEQKAREDSLYRFSNGSTNIFVCTDLGSRGLDIPDVENVIHYHIPENEDSYIHRAGRTARWKSNGNTYFILGPEENIPDYVNSVIENFSIPEELPAPALPVMTTLYIGKGKNDKISKGDIVGFLCKKGKLSIGDIGKIDVRDRYSYVAIKRTTMNAVLDLICGEKIKGLKTIIEQIK